MLNVKDLCFEEKKCPGGFLIKDISFDLDDGYMMSLVGKNGSGKTTLINLLYGMLTPASGKIRWQGKDITDNICAYHDEVAYVGADKWCFEGISLMENVDLLRLLYKNFDESMYREYMKLFGFKEEDAKKKYYELSTGQKIQFELAFVLARRPKLMLLDEPTANLDPIIRTELIDILHQRVMRDNMSIIISTHLVDDISDMTDYIAIMEAGRINVFGDREDVFEIYDSASLRELLTCERRR